MGQACHQIAGTLCQLEELNIIRHFISCMERQGLLDLGRVYQVSAEIAESYDKLDGIKGKFAVRSHCHQNLVCSKRCFILSRSPQSIEVVVHLHQGNQGLRKLLLVQMRIITLYILNSSLASTQFMFAYYGIANTLLKTPSCELVLHALGVQVLADTSVSIPQKLVQPCERVDRMIEETQQMVHGLLQRCTRTKALPVPPQLVRPHGALEPLHSQIFGSSLFGICWIDPFRQVNVSIFRSDLHFHGRTHIFTQPGLRCPLLKIFPCRRR
mmetsp:Transcript_33866/g.95906  ORF Transcript_33866/g.95906 Transcript_33866/m.95906 type:complete len:269 (-) Transcript_33866:1050-1856(-)